MNRATRRRLRQPIRSRCKCTAGQCCWEPLPVVSVEDVGHLFAGLQLQVDAGAAAALGISR